MTFSIADFWTQMARALSWVLIHSIWQGIAAVLLAAVIISLTKKSPPALRYNLLSGVLLTFVVANLCTFLWLLNAGFVQPNFLAAVTFKDILPNAERFSNAASHSYFNLKTLTHFLNQQASNIALIWALVFAFKTFQTTTGYLYNRHLIRTALPAAADWQRLTNQLAARLGIFKDVTLLISNALETPAASGFFRQVIIVPAGFLTSLPHAQVEAILLHELAHIRRRDYLVNALQCICENIYFFNPAILWLSSLIRREREHCCDDLVVRITADETTYVNALVAFRQMQVDSSKTLTAFPGNRNQLLARIKRVISNHNQPLQTMEKLSITAGIVAFAALSFVSFAEKKHLEEARVTVSPVVVATKEAPRTVTLALKPVSKKPVKSLSKPEKTTQTLEDTSKFFGNKLSEVEAAISSEDFDKARDLQLKAATGLWKEKAALKNRETQLRLQTEAFSKNKQQPNGKLQVLALSDEILKNESEKLEKKRNELADAQAELDRTGAQLWKQFNAMHRAEASENQEKLIESLIASGIIKNRENLSFKLHNMFLVVNGVEQPESVHRELKAKFLKNTWTEYVYNWDGATGYRFTGVRYNG